MHTNKEFLLKELKKVKIEGPIMIEGLPGMGNVGKITIDFIIESLKAEKIAEVYSHSFNHCIFVQEDGLAELPKIEIYFKKIKRQDYVIVTGDVQPVDERGCYGLCEGLIEYFISKKGNEIITLGGIGLEDIPKEPRVFICGNSSKIVKKYREKGVGENIFNIVGPILGVSGVLVGVAKMHNIPAISILAETFGNPLYLGVKGARGIIKLLELKLKLGLDLKALDKEIKDVEKEVKFKVEKIQLLPQDETVVEKKHSTNYIG